MSETNEAVDDESVAVIGHNSGDKPKKVVAMERLRSIVERIERLEEERKDIGGSIRDIKLEAKSAGFDVKVLSQLLKLRKQDPNDVEEEETLLDVYKRALDM